MLTAAEQRAIDETEEMLAKIGARRAHQKFLAFTRMKYDVFGRPQPTPVARHLKKLWLARQKANSRLRDRDGYAYDHQEKPCL